MERLVVLGENHTSRQKKLSQLSSISKEHSTVFGILLVPTTVAQEHSIKQKKRETIVRCNTSTSSIVNSFCSFYFLHSLPCTSTSSLCLSFSLRSCTCIPLVSCLFMAMVDSQCACIQYKSGEILHRQVSVTPSYARSSILHCLLIVLQHSSLYLYCSVR